MEKVAVVVDADNSISTLFDAKSIVIYSKRSGVWEEDKTIPVSLDKNSGMSLMRSSMMEIIASMDTCKIIAGKEISGIPYNMLDAAGFSIFETEGNPRGLLDSVISMVNENTFIEQERADKESKLPRPEPIDPDGNYRIDLAFYQKCQPIMSSKKILLPFLRNTVFHSLEVVCSHVPPWFGVELEQLGLLAETEKIKDNYFKVTILHKTCSD